MNHVATNRFTRSRYFPLTTSSSIVCRGLPQIHTSAENLLKRIILLFAYYNYSHNVSGTESTLLFTGAVLMSTEVFIFISRMWSNKLTFLQHNNEFPKLVIKLSLLACRKPFREETLRIKMSTQKSNSTRSISFCCFQRNIISASPMNFIH